MRICVGLLFIYAGASKLMDIAAFRMAIEMHGLVPDEWITLLSLYIPWLEIICGIALFAGHLVQAARIVTTTLLAIFTLVALRAFALDLDASCGCFGVGASDAWHWVALRNIALIVLVNLTDSFPRQPVQIQENG